MSATPKPDEITKAKRLLDLLRRRTVDRGATAAEAAQAAELAERLIRRYGLDDQPDDESDQEFAIREKRLPKWADMLAFGIRLRFGLQMLVAEQRGKPCRIKFRGPEHRVSVAVWLFDAIASDLRLAAARDVQVTRLKGPEMVIFRNEHLYCAALKVYTRLNAEAMERAHKEAETQRKLAGDSKPCEPTKPKRTKAIARRPTAADRRRDQIKSVAMRHGLEAGRRVAIDANALPSTAAEPLRLTEARR